MYYPLTPKIYAEMMRLGETKPGVIRLALCQYFKIDQNGKSRLEINKLLDAKLAAEAKLRGIPKRHLFRDIVDDYLARQPTIQTRPPEEIDAEIENRIRVQVCGQKRCIANTKRRILAHRLRISEQRCNVPRIARELERQANAVGKTCKEVERDLLCVHFGILQVVEC